MFSADTMIDAALMRQLFAADPDNLPEIYAHPTALWRTAGGKPAPARIDSKKNIHMSIADLLLLKKELPLEGDRREGDVLIFKIALQRHHLEGGVNDRVAPAQTDLARKRGLRERLGFDPLTGGPKRANDGVPHIVLGRKKVKFARSPPMRALGVKRGIVQ